MKGEGLRVIGEEFIGPLGQELGRRENLTAQKSGGEPWLMLY